ncbi:MAG TPA: branched-chain amino acid ABC transporter permease [Myxococcales bacterium]|nr:branched-chain amino acid ABC transporter permease [Myxococcales bacterium]
MRAALLALAATAFTWFLLRAESQEAIGLLVALAVVAGVLAARFPPRRGAAPERLVHALAVAAVIALSLLLREDDFSLLLICRILIVVVACLGLNVQFGYAGVVNFAGASFFGVGGYTAAVLSRATGLPHLFVLFCGGAAAALAGTVLLLPVLRTRGHYAALVTIAFALLFRTFLEVNDTLGGPQGLKLRELVIGPFHFNDPIEIGPFEGSFYLRYVALSLALASASFALVRRLERSSAGVALDAVRLDELAAASFGLDVARWKITAFTLGNFVTGVAGALSAFMIGFIAPNNYTFAESLIFVSILLLGGIGNPWGLSLAAAIVILLPEKLQVIQEYRFLLFAAMVILILLFRPAGLVPRPLRRLGPRT